MTLSEIMTEVTKGDKKRSYIYEPLIIDVACMKLFLSASTAKRLVSGAVEYSIPLEAVTGNALFEAIVAKKKDGKHVICMPITQQQANAANLDLKERAIYAAGVQIATLEDDKSVLTSYDAKENKLIVDDSMKGYVYKLVLYEKPE